MTHFVGLVVCNDEEDMEQLLAPYDEQKPVAPYFEELSTEENEDGYSQFKAMAKHYKTDDPKKLVEHMEDWCGGPGEIKDGKLGSYSTYNPDSEWDWYEVGGRWDGIVPHNQCLAEEVKQHFADQDYIPSVLVDKKGWHSTKKFGWWGTSKPVEGKDNIVEQKLKEHKGKLVYIVDFHI